MPWWFWVITHLWAACSAGLLIMCLEDKTVILDKSGILISIFVILFSLPICAGSFIWMLFDKFMPDEGKRKMKKLFKWIGRKIKRPLKWIIEYKERWEDFKEIEENEDEWEAERVGIKVKD